MLTTMTETLQHKQMIGVKGCHALSATPYIQSLVTYLHSDVLSASQARVMAAAPGSLNSECTTAVSTVHNSWNQSRAL